MDTSPIAKAACRRCNDRKSIDWSDIIGWDRRSEPPTGPCPSCRPRDAWFAYKKGFLGLGFDVRFSFSDQGRRHRAFYFPPVKAA
jgi:hypothetical protein